MDMHIQDGRMRKYFVRNEAKGNIFYTENDKDNLTKQNFEIYSITLSNGGNLILSLFPVKEMLQS